MPDYSYFPEGYDHTVVFPNATNVGDILKTSFQVATFEQAAVDAGVDFKSEHTLEGRIFAFRSAEDMASVQSDVESQENTAGNGLTHVEDFAVDHDPLYMKAWLEVVSEKMKSEGHELSSIVADPEAQTVTIEFPTQEAKDTFDRIDAQNDFIDFAIGRRAKLTRDLDIEAGNTGAAIDNDHHIAA